MKKKVERPEKEVAALEQRQRTLTGDLERPETYADSSRAMNLNRELMGVADSLERTTAEWEASVAELETSHSPAS